MRTITRSLTFVSVAAVLAACGTPLPPKELIDARAAYQKAQAGPASQQSPAELHVAKQALEGAESEFAAEGDSPQTKDRAYIAIRKAQLAEATARTSVAAAEKKEAEAEVAKFSRDTIRKTRSELQTTKTALEREKEARLEAEKRAAEALSDLQKIAAVKKDDRGMVITLSGGVLFKTDKADLTAPALAQLNKVAEALIRNSPDSKIVVEGHTDAQGSAAHNRELSQKRAESVATYLVGRGIAQDRVSAMGIGPDRPIADNNSTEGRAQNRRVEIIVH